MRRKCFRNIQDCTEKKNKKLGTNLNNQALNFQLSICPTIQNHCAVVNNIWLSVKISFALFVPRAVPTSSTICRISVYFPETPNEANAKVSWSGTEEVLSPEPTSQNVGPVGGESSFRTRLDLCKAIDSPTLARSLSNSE